MPAVDLQKGRTRPRGRVPGPQLLLGRQGVQGDERSEGVPLAAGGTSLVRGQNNSPRHRLRTLCRNMPADAVRVMGLDGSPVALRCKSWGCDDCRPWLKRRLKRAITWAAEENRQLQRFATFTLPGRTDSVRSMEPKARQLVLTRRWDAWKKRLERDSGRKLAYCQVRELQRDGTPHIHALVDRFIPWAKAQAAWKAVGGGSVDIRLVHPNRVSAYMSKYMVKDDQPLPKGCRKYSSGGGVRLEGVRPAPSGGKWHVQVATPGGILGDWTAVYDPRPAFGFLQRKRPPPQQLRDAISRAVRQRELEDQAAAAAAAAELAARCSCDGGPAPRPGCCSPGR